MKKFIKYAFYITIYIILVLLLGIYFYKNGIGFL